MSDLEGLLFRLVRHKVAFVVAGGYAAAAHGCTLLTLDIDVCCDFSVDNLMRLQTAIQDLHPVHRMTPGRLPLELSEASAHGLKNLYLDTDDGPLDCLGAIAGIGGYAEVFALSEEIPLPDATACRVLTLEGIIRAKKAMDRPRDQEAVLQLEAIRERLCK